MTTRPTAGITRLKGRYYNENAVSASNPGGLDESADGLTAGHVTNFPAALVDLGEVASYVGDVADQIVAAQSTIVMTWDAGIGAADPGAGKLRASTATVTAGTYNLYVSTTDAVGVSVAALLAAVGGSTSTVKARGRLVKVGDPAVYLDLLVTGVTGSGAYRTVAVTFAAGPGGFAAGDAVVFGWFGTGDTVRWLSGAGAPGAGTGNDGDYYLNTSTGDVYLKTAGAWGGALIRLKGVDGTPGSNGSNGATWYSGSGAPAAGLGANGDYYLRTDTGAVYTRAAGAWSVSANITGPQGPSGNNKICEGGTATGAANAITLTASPAFTGARGEMVIFKTGASANTGATNITSNGVTQAARKNGSALSGGELPANTRVAFVSDGTYLEMVGAPASGVAVQKDGVAVATRSAINIVPGAGISAIVTDDAANGRVSIQIDNTSYRGARYWRLRNPSMTGIGDDRCGITEWQVFTTPDATGTDITTGKTATASSELGTANSAAKAIDDTGTAWSSAFGGALGWVQVDFGSAVAPRSMIVQLPAGSWSGSVILEWSTDTSTWAALSVLSVAAGAAGTYTFTYLQ